MTHIAPNHFSINFKLDPDSSPIVKTDKFSTKLALFGLLGGLLFALLGAYEILSYFFRLENTVYNFTLPPEMSLRQLIILRYTFDTFILLFGLVIITISLAAMHRRKTIAFDGKTVKVTHHPLFGSALSLEDELYNYAGVLLKVEYFQLGLITRNRYIIELYHTEPNKRIPLYISTSGNNIQQIWKEYARKLKMPALFITDHGIISKHHAELDKTLLEMSKRWHIKNDKPSETIPSSVKYRNKNTYAVFKETHNFFDIYSLLTLLTAIIFCCALLGIIYNYNTLIATFGGIIVALATTICLGFILAIIICLFSKDVLIVTPREVMLGHNFFFIRADTTALPKKDIESVDIGHNPISDRYYLSIIAHHGNIIFGKNMPIDDLQRIRGYIIREIIK